VPASRSTQKIPTKDEMAHAATGQAPRMNTPPVGVPSVNAPFPRAATSPAQRVPPQTPRDSDPVMARPATPLPVTDQRSEPARAATPQPVADQRSGPIRAVVDQRSGPVRMPPPPINTERKPVMSSPPPVLSEATDATALEELLDSGKIDDALAAYKVMAKKFPQDRAYRAGIELCEGFRAAVARDRLEAAQRFEAALEIDPSNERAARELAEMRRLATNERKGLLSRLMGKKEPPP
jgi:hypothetical protein